MTKYMTQQQYDEWIERMQNTIINEDEDGDVLTALDLYEWENPYENIVIVGGGNDVE